MNKTIRTALIGAAALLSSVTVAFPVSAYAQTAAPTHKTATRAHKRVAASSRVKAIQEALNKAGATLKADGKMGKDTRAAIKKFQSEHGLKATGYANKVTLKALGVK